MSSLSLGEVNASYIPYFSVWEQDLIKEGKRLYEGFFFPAAQVKCIIPNNQLTSTLADFLH